MLSLFSAIWLRASHRTSADLSVSFLQDRCIKLNTAYSQAFDPMLPSGHCPFSLKVSSILSPLHHLSFSLELTPTGVTFPLKSSLSGEPWPPSHPSKWSFSVSLVSHFSPWTLSSLSSQPAPASPVRPSCPLLPLWYLKSSCIIFFMVLVLVSSDVCNKLPQTCWLKTTEIYSPNISGGQRSQVSFSKLKWKCSLLCKALGRNLFLASNNLWWLSTILGSWLFTLISASVITLPFLVWVCVCVCIISLCLPVIRIHAFAFKAYANSAG